MKVVLLVMAAMGSVAFKASKGFECRPKIVYKSGRLRSRSDKVRTASPFADPSLAGQITAQEKASSLRSIRSALNRFRQISRGTATQFKKDESIPDPEPKEATQRLTEPRHVDELDLEEGFKIPSISRNGSVMMTAAGVASEEMNSQAIIRRAQYLLRKNISDNTANAIKSAIVNAPRVSVGNELDDSLPVLTGELLDEFERSKTFSQDKEQPLMANIISETKVEAPVSSKLISDLYFHQDSQVVEDTKNLDSKSDSEAKTKPHISPFIGTQEARYSVDKDLSKEDILTSKIRIAPKITEKNSGSRVSRPIFKIPAVKIESPTHKLFKSGSLSAPTLPKYETEKVETQKSATLPSLTEKLGGKSESVLPSAVELYDKEDVVDADIEAERQELLDEREDNKRTSRSLRRRRGGKLSRKSMELPPELPGDGSDSGGNDPNVPKKSERRKPPSKERWFYNEDIEEDVEDDRASMIPVKMRKLDTMLPSESAVFTEEEEKSMAREEDVPVTYSQEKLSFDDGGVEVRRVGPVRMDDDKSRADRWRYLVEAGNRMHLEPDELNRMFKPRNRELYMLRSNPFLAYGAIVQLEGVLVDMTEQVLPIWQKLSLRHRLPTPRLEDVQWAASLSPFQFESFSDSVFRIFGRLPHEERLRRMQQEFITIFSDTIRNPNSKIRLKTDSAQWIESFLRKGVKVSIASKFPVELVKTVLRAAGLDPNALGPNGIIANEKLQEDQLLLRGSLMMFRQPKFTLFVTDVPSGATSAYRAGMRSLSLHGRYAKRIYSDSTVIVKSLSDFHPMDLRSAFSEESFEG